jgi:hypothetical protein
LGGFEIDILNLVLVWNLEIEISSFSTSLDSASREVSWSKRNIAEKSLFYIETYG